MQVEVFVDAINKKVGDERKLSLRQGQAVLDVLLSDRALARKLIEYILDHVPLAQELLSQPPPAERATSGKPRPAQPAKVPSGPDLESLHDNSRV